MATSRSTRVDYPLFVRCIACLALTACFPAVVIAAVFGAPVSWEMVVMSGMLSAYGLAVVTGNKGSAFFSLISALAKLMRKLAEGESSRKS